MTKLRPTAPKPPSPLWLHASGNWGKKIRGRTHYFGHNHAAAVQEYYRQKDDLEAGRVPKPKAADAVTVGRLCNDILTWKRNRVTSGEISAVMWNEYRIVTDRLVEVLKPGRTVTDLAPADFDRLRTDAAGRLGVYSLKKFITLARAVFAYAYAHELIPAPVRYGSSFDKPTKAKLTLARRAKGKKLISAADLCRMIDAADTQFRAMLYLGINAGYGASDCARLTRSMLAAEPGWIDAPRVKTAAERRVPLWPETTVALAAVRDVRPDPKRDVDEDLVFVTVQGNPWVRHNDRGTDKPVSRVDTVAANFARVAEKCGLELPGGFYLLRHTFRTHADEVRDTPAARLIMGHTGTTIDDTYRERIGDDRLVALVEHVREWMLKGRTTSGA
jgi:integrase